jgi:hypothetical protein
MRLKGGKISAQTTLDLRTTTSSTGTVYVLLSEICREFFLEVADLTFARFSKISVCKIIEAKQFWDANKKKEAQLIETERKGVFSHN